MATKWNYTNAELYDLLQQSKIRFDEANITLEADGVLVHRARVGDGYGFLFSEYGLKRNFTIAYDFYIDETCTAGVPAVTGNPNTDTIATDVSGRNFFVTGGAVGSTAWGITYRTPSIYPYSSPSRVYNEPLTAGWHSLVCTKNGNEVRLWIDGRLKLYSNAPGIVAKCCLALVWDGSDTLNYKMKNFRLSTHANDFTGALDVDNVYASVAKIDFSSVTTTDGTISAITFGTDTVPLSTRTLTVEVPEDLSVLTDIVDEEGSHYLEYHNLLAVADVRTESDTDERLLAILRKNHVAKDSFDTFNYRLDAVSGVRWVANTTQRPGVGITDYKVGNSALTFGDYLDNTGSNGQPIIYSLSAETYTGGDYNESDFCGLAISITQRPDQVYETVRVVLGSNLATKSGLSFRDGANADYWTEHYTLSRPTYNLMSMTLEQTREHSIRQIMHRDRYLFLFNGVLVLDVKDALFDDLAPLTFQIFHVEFNRYDRYVTRDIKITKYAPTPGGDPEDLKPLAEILAGAGSAPRLAIMIESDGLAEPICLYRGYTPVLLATPSGAVHEFKPTGMSIELPERRAGSADALSFGIGDVSGEVLAYCEQIRDSAKPAYITVLQYPPFNEFDTAEDTAPVPIYNLRLFITTCAITTKGATFSAGWHDTLNAKFPYRRYTATDFPGLKYVS